MAARPKAVTVADHERLFFTRWVLLLLAANEAAGLPEVSRERLHALLFMSFASSRYYGIEPLRQRARRTEQGPYYRMAHIALGALALAGLIDVRDFAAHPAPRDLQFEGVFRPTLLGLKVARVLRETLAGAGLYRFLLDMCLAAAHTTEVAADDLRSTILDRVLEEDLTYRRAIGRHSDILEMEDYPEEGTPTVKGLNSIDERLRQQGGLNRKDVVAAYQTLLQQRTAKAA